MKKQILILVFLFLFVAVYRPPTSAAILSSDSSQESQPDRDPRSEQQVNAYNEQAVKLFEEGRFEEAQELWEKALEILEDPLDHVQDYQDLKSAVDTEEGDSGIIEIDGKFDKENIDRLYDAGVSLFKKERYVASKKVFERIEGTLPDYKAARNYLTILEHKISQARQNLTGKSFEKNAIARREERAEWDRILEESRMELEKKLAQQVDPIYQEAIGYYKSREFKLAKDYFAEVDGILPGYQDTKKYLSRINKDIRDEEERLIEEKRKREILARKKEKEEWNRILQESERELQKKLIEQVDPVYQTAVHYYKKRKFELAKSRFEEAQMIVPNYKSTAQYLDRIDRDMQEDVRLRQERRARELEQQKKDEEMARMREEQRHRELREAKEKERLDQFKMEVAARRKERQEWLKTLEESERERQQKLKDQAQYIYQEAVKYYKKRQFEQAKEDFLEVRRIYPGYQSTEKYLAGIDKDIEEERKQRYEEQQLAFRRQLREKKLLEQQKWEEEQKLRAIEEQNRLKEFKDKVLAREKQRGEWERIIEENERERRKKLEEEAEFIYQEALRSYNAKRWEEARTDFMEVAQILPGYKLTDKYLAGIDDDIQSEEQERRRAARESLEQRKSEEAFARSQEAERQAQLRKADEKKEYQRKEAQAQAVYQFAVSLDKRGNYRQAKDKFLEVEQILSGYKSTAKYLKRLDQDIEKAEESRRKEQQLAFERQIREQRLAQKREEDRITQLRSAEEERRLLKLKEEALLREQERKQWERTIGEIEKEHKKRLEQQTDSVYEEALRYYKAGWLEQAKETLEEVNAMWPGYKSTDKYLVRIDSQIRSNRRLREESEEEIAQRQEWQKELARQKQTTRQSQLRKTEEQERIVKLKQEALARGIEKEKLKESMDQIERDHQKKAQRKAKALYRNALQYYNDGEFEKAKIAFIDVERACPGYKSAAKYLTRIDDDIADEKLAAAKVTVRGREGYGAETGFSGLEKNGNKFVEEASQKRRDDFIRAAEEKYREAIALYTENEFIRAKMKFIEVESLSPGYKETLDYLDRIDSDISQNREWWIEQKKSDSKAEVSFMKDYGRNAVDQKQDVVRQALLEVERRFQEPPRETARLPVQEQRMDDGQPVDWERQIHARREELRRQRGEIRKEYEKQFNQLYAKAVQLYRNGSYEEARALFLQIEEMKPGYKRASSYLKKADAKMQKGLQRTGNHNVVLHPKEMKPRDNIVEETLDSFERKL